MDAGMTVLSEGAAADGEPEQTDEGKGEVTAKDQGIEERGAIINIEHEVGKQERGEGHGEFVFAGKINRAAKSDGGERGEIGKPGASSALHDDGRGDPVNNRQQD